MKFKDVFYIVKDDYKIKHLCGGLFNFLNFKRSGQILGNSVLLPILPETRKKEELKKVLSTFYSVINFKKNLNSELTSILYTKEKEYYNKLFWQINRHGEVTAMTVPAEWMIITN